ncbi:Rpn family recombination-promoting nuclease/putative transposase [Breznakiellaceae bacterium SP9]
MKIVQFTEDDDLIDICYDNVFKAVFTKGTPESRGALNKLLEALLGRQVEVITITANEPPVDDTRERQIRFDIQCRFETAERANIEMTLNPDAFEAVRLAYYASKLFCSQDIRGKDKSYKDLQHSYQISLLVNDPLFADKELIHQFEYYDKTRKTSLEGRVHIITVELSKLEAVVEKAVKTMTPSEEWAVFFRYSTDKSKRGIINEILTREEGVAMAGTTLLTISRDDVERARLLSQYKSVVDVQSKMVDAKREGIAIGEAKGKQEGKIETRVLAGLKQGSWVRLTQRSSTGFIEDPFTVQFI